MSKDAETIQGTIRTPLRVMGWNFLEGGLGPLDATGRRNPIPERRAAALALIQKLSPDILVLNEALGCTPGAVEADTDYASWMGYPHGAAARYDHEWGNAIVSRYPIIEVRQGLLYEEGAPNNRGWLAVCIQTPSQSVWVGTYHPHPGRRPHLRCQDVAQLLDTMSGPAVFLGDLNAVSLTSSLSEDSVRTTFENFQEPDRAARSAALFYQSGQVLFNPQDGLFPSRGWVSAISETGPSLPTALIRKPGDLGLQIDHAWVSPGIGEAGVVAGWVDRSQEADVASDHYPLVADLLV